ncbi:MAG TPA: o-succinylbenzoate synthase [Bacteroidales bacterium]|nr:o-succinylbenzoate synthase [Bacteroidales bacterium]
MTRFEAQAYHLVFRFAAGTSRGVLTNKHGWIIRLTDVHNPLKTGVGECSLIPGLSPENTSDLEARMAQLTGEAADFRHIVHDLREAFPSLAFAVETALLDLENGGKMRLFPSAFVEGKQGIPINGLIWMGEIEEMKERFAEKIKEGYTTIKLKVGALNFDDELALLKGIRNEYSPADLSLRLDANGAFAPHEALEKLKRLSEFHIHSIEQPIKPGQPEQMSELCQKSPVPIALDEELIGVRDHQMFSLLNGIRPQYIILKPSLLGGLSRSREWMDTAESLGIGWWVTSALESNIGLNAIAQWTASLNTTIPQGLGTGQLYHNNFASPLYISRAQLWHNPDVAWSLPL